MNCAWMGFRKGQANRLAGAQSAQRRVVRSPGVGFGEYPRTAPESPASRHAGLKLVSPRGVASDCLHNTRYAKNLF